MSGLHKEGKFHSRPQRARDGYVQVESSLFHDCVGERYCRGCGESSGKRLAGCGDRRDRFDDHSEREWQRGDAGWRLCREIEPNSAVPLWDTPAETTPCGTVEIDNLLIQQSIGGGIHQELMLNFARRDSLGASGANDAERPRNFASRRQHGSDGRRLLAFSRPGWLGPPWLALKVAYSRAYTSGSPHEQLLIGFIYTMRPGFARHTHL